VCPNVPKKFFEKISQTVPKVPKKFLGKIGFLNPCARTCPRNEKSIRCPRNPIFGKNRISQTVCPNVPKKFFEKISQTVPKVAKKFLGKIGFLNPCARTCPRNEKSIRCPRNPIFEKNRISFEK
jgi:hypothetical protein